jgi:K+/H+ antiporter YhaU regulatory subunit KhtT
MLPRMPRSWVPNLKGKEVLLSKRTRKTFRKKLHFERGHIEEVLQQPLGNGVDSIPIGKESKLTGLALSGLALRNADVLVFSIQRDEEMIPIPKAQTRTQIGDRRNCNGKLENLKGLVLARE